jgi:hypothetical protein
MTFVFFLNAVEYSTMGHFSSVKIAHYLIPYGFLFISM